MPRTLDHLNDAISVLTPLSLAETSWDNVGVMVESPRPRQIARGTKRAVYLCIDRESRSSPSRDFFSETHPPLLFFSDASSREGSLVEPFDRVNLDVPPSDLWRVETVDARQLDPTVAPRMRR